MEELAHSSWRYPNSVQTITNRESHSKLKELAHGESNIKAEVKVKIQNELIKLVRYINLTETCHTPLI